MSKYKFLASDVSNSDDAAIYYNFIMFLSCMQITTINDTNILSDSIIQPRLFALREIFT